MTDPKTPETKPEAIDDADLDEATGGAAAFTTDADDVRPVRVAAGKAPLGDMTILKKVDN